MRIDIISALPKIVSGPLDQSIIKRAAANDIVEIHVHDLRDFLRFGPVGGRAARSRKPYQLRHFRGVPRLSDVPDLAHDRPRVGDESFPARHGVTQENRYDFPGATGYRRPDGTNRSALSVARRNRISEPDVQL